MDLSRRRLCDALWYMLHAHQRIVKQLFFVCKETKKNIVEEVTVASSPNANMTADATSTPCRTDLIGDRRRRRLLDDEGLLT